MAAAAAQSRLAGALAVLDADGSGILTESSFGTLLGSLGLTEQDTCTLLSNMPPAARLPAGGLCLHSVIRYLYDDSDSTPKDEHREHKIESEAKNNLGQHAQSWTLQGWLGSLGFPAALAGCVQGHLCGPEGDHNGCMLAFMKHLRESGDKHALRDLLLRCKALDAVVDVLWAGAADLVQAGATSGRELNEKFLQSQDNFEMSYGSIADFFGGLEKFIGAPDPKLCSAMEREHCALNDADAEFTTGNYGITTTPKTEWLFATGAAPDSGWPAETKNCEEEHRRQPGSHDWLQAKLSEANALLRQHGEPDMKEEEAIGLRLYTGPMFQIYNKLLRAVAQRKKRDALQEELDKMAARESGMSAKEKEELEKKRAALIKLEADVAKSEDAMRGGNTYTTTIHAINSALVKLGKVQKATKVYRGLSGGLLPKEFWQPNQWGVCGGVENGFLSTTVDRDVAMAYAASDPKKAGTVFEIQMSMVDRGADLRWVSQYPHEAELCFAPLTGLQVISTRVEKSVLVVEARLNVNLVSLTIEEVIAKRHKMVSQLCTEFCDEVYHTVTKADGEWKPVAEELLRADTSGVLWRDSIKRMHQAMQGLMREQITSGEPQDMNVNENLVQAVGQAVSTKNAFESVTRDSMMFFLLEATASKLKLPRSEVTDDILRLLTERCPHLRSAKFAGCEKVTDDGVGALAEKCRNLQEVDFSRCVQLTDSAVQRLTDKCDRLQHVSLVQCPRLTAGAVKHLAETCNGLQSLNVGGCSDLTDDSVRHLAEKCRDLRDVSFEACPLLTDHAVRHIAETCKAIQHVGFAECPLLTDGAVKHLAEACRALQHVRFTGCPLLTDEAWRHLAEHSERLPSAVLGRLTWKWAEQGVLAEGRHLTDTVVRLLADRCRGMLRVGFAECTDLTDDAVMHLAARCSGLQEAAFTHCVRLTDAAAAHLAERCPDLQKVDFTSCSGLTDAAVTHLGASSSRLQEVVFAGCSQLTDEAAEHLAAGCPDLQKVDFTNCSDLTNAAVRLLAASCSGLLEAVLAGCPRLTDDAAEHLAAGCRDLRSISFAAKNPGETQITDAAVRRLAESCKGLQQVDFTHCKHLTDAAVGHLAASCPGLQEAVFTNCQELTDAAAAHLADGCPDLRRLSFGFGPACGYNHSLTDEAVRRLAEGCRGLEQVDFRQCTKLTDRSLGHLAERCPGLQQVAIGGGDEVTDRGVELLAARCPGLRQVDFADCRALTDAAVGHLAASCPGLQQAVFTNCRKLTDAAAAHLADVCWDLRHVSFGCPSTYPGNVRVTDEAVRRLADGCRGLEQVDFRQCTNLTDRALGHLAEHCPGLRQAVFGGCDELTDSGVEQLAARCPGLQQVDFGWCRKLTDRSVEQLASHCPGLQQVDVAGCKLLTDRAVQALAERCPGLRCADLRDCRSATQGALDRLRAALPQCELLWKDPWKNEEEEEQEEEQEDEAEDH